MCALRIQRFSQHVAAALATPNPAATTNFESGSRNPAPTMTLFFYKGYPWTCQSCLNKLGVNGEAPASQVQRPPSKCKHSLIPKPVRMWRSLRHYSQLDREDFQNRYRLTQGLFFSARPSWSL